MSQKMLHQQPSRAVFTVGMGWLRALRTSSLCAGIMAALCTLPGLAQAQSAQVVVTAPAVRVVAPPPPAVVVQQPVVVAPPPRRVYVPPPTRTRVVVVAPQPRPQRVVVVHEPGYGPGRGWKHGWKRGRGWKHR